jgi:hypothetical protein
VPRGNREIPVWAFVRDYSGTPTRIALETIDPATLGPSTSVDLYAYSPTQSYWDYWYIDDIVVRRPASGMDVSSTSLYVSERLYFSDSESLLIGVNAVPHNTYSEVDWISFGDLDSELAASMVAEAEDDFGRLSLYFAHGTVDSLALPAIVTLGSPPIPSSPASGASGVAVTPTLSFAPMSGTEVTYVEITDSATGQEWTLVVPGAQTSVTLPSLPGDGLQSGHSYTWRVISFEIPGLDYNRYLDSALTTGIQAYSVSETRTFTTQ